MIYLYLAAFVVVALTLPIRKILAEMAPRTKTTADDKALEYLDKVAPYLTEEHLAELKTLLKV